MQFHKNNEVECLFSTSVLISTFRFVVGQYVTVEDEVISHVNISHVRVEDGGQYACRASNSVGSVQHRAAVRVYGAPFIRDMRPVTAVAGADLILTCPAAGYPIDNIFWEKGKSTVTSGKQLMSIWITSDTHRVRTQNNINKFSKYFYVYFLTYYNSMYFFKILYLYMFSKLELVYRQGIRHKIWYTWRCWIAWTRMVQKYLISKVLCTSTFDQRVMR